MIKENTFKTVNYKDIEINIPNNIKLYHGTSYKHKSNIAKFGLDPKQSKWENQSFIWLDPLEGAALSWGEWSYNEHIVVYELNINDLDKELLNIDLNNYDYYDGLIRDGEELTYLDLSYVYAGVIPPQSLAIVYEELNENKRGKEMANKNKIKREAQEPKQLTREIIKQYVDDVVGSKGMYVYRDYDDTLDLKTIDEILTAENPRDFYNNLEDEIWFEHSGSYLIEVVDAYEADIIQSLNGDGYTLTDEDAEYLLDTLQEKGFDLPNYLEDRFSAYIEIATPHEVNLDLGGSFNRTFYGLDIDEENLNDAEQSFIGYLCKEQGYKVKDVLNAIYGDGTHTLLRQSHFVNTLSAEIANGSYIQATTVIGQLTIEEAIQLKEGTATLTLTPNDTLGLFDTWSGAGGMFELTLEKNINVPTEYIFHIGTAERSGGGYPYTPEEVYGFSGSVYRKPLTIIKAETKKESKSESKTDLTKDGKTLTIIDSTTRPSGKVIALVKWGKEFVVAYGYNQKEGYWQQGHYYSTEEQARKKFDRYLMESVKNKPLNKTIKVELEVFPEEVDEYLEIFSLYPWADRVEITTQYYSKNGFATICLKGWANDVNPMVDGLDNVKYIKESKTEAKEIKGTVLVLQYLRGKYFDSYTFKNLDDAEAFIAEQGELNSKLANYNFEYIIEELDEFNESKQENFGMKNSYRKGDLVYHKEHGYGVVISGGRGDTLRVNFSNKPVDKNWTKAWATPPSHPDYDRWKANAQQPIGILINVKDLTSALAESKDREEDYLSKEHLTKVAKMFNYNSGKMLEYLDKIVIEKDLDITYGDLDGLITAFLMYNTPTKSTKRENTSTPFGTKTYKINDKMTTEDIEATIRAIVEEVEYFLIRELRKGIGNRIGYSVIEDLINVNFNKEAMIIEATFIDPSAYFHFEAEDTEGFELLNKVLPIFKQSAKDLEVLLIRLAKGQLD